MRRRMLLTLLITLLLATVLTACGGAPKIDWELEIKGAVSNPMTLSYQDLVKREQVDLSDVMMLKSQGEDELTSWSGPALAPILDEAGISANAATLVCMAADGYAKEIPMADLDHAIIALKRNGEWTTDDKGPIRIVVPNLPANNWLFQLTSIEVME